MKTDGVPPGTTKNLGSYYRRPSAAIEQGGGFFVPGLQGFRLRLILALIILGLLSLDGVARPGMSLSQVVSEALAALAGCALLAQALLDQQKEQAVKARREAIASASSGQAGDEAVRTAEGEISFFDSAALGSGLEGRIRWAADILLQLTAGCSFVAFSDGKLLARVGVTGGESDDTSVLATAFERAAAEERGSSAIVKRSTTPSRENDGGDGEQISAIDGRDDVTMQLLPSACRQGILCRVSTCGSFGEGGGDVVVLLGSTLLGAGVFSGMDGAWFERVCAQIALGGLADGDRSER